MTFRRRLISWVADALREVEEEAGVVRYWIMRPIRGEAAPHNEVDAVRWVPVAQARQILTYERDRTLLDALPRS